MLIVAWKEDSRAIHGKISIAVMRALTEAMKHRAISWLVELFGGRTADKDTIRDKHPGRHPPPACSVMTFGTPFHTEKSQLASENSARYVFVCSHWQWCVFVSFDLIPEANLDLTLKQKNLNLFSQLIISNVNTYFLSNFIL